jgi:hypothetical protein
MKAMTIKPIGEGSYKVCVTGAYNVEIHVATVINTNHNLPPAVHPYSRPWRYETRFFTIVPDEKIGKGFTTKEAATEAAIKQLVKTNQFLSAIDFSLNGPPKESTPEVKPGATVATPTAPTAPDLSKEADLSKVETPKESTPKESTPKESTPEVKPPAPPAPPAPRPVTDSVGVKTPKATDAKRS